MLALGDSPFIAVKRTDQCRITNLPSDAPTMKSCLLLAAAVAALQPSTPPRHSRVVLHTSKKSTTTRQRPKGAGRERQGRRRGDLIQGIYDAPALIDDSSAVQDDPLLPFVEALAHAADMRKGRNIVAFHTAPLTDVASFVIAACGRSRPQCNAVAAAVVDDAKELFSRVPNHVEGGADGGWTCIDFGDVIVNVMTPQAREFYNIDEIWRVAETVDLSDIVSPEGPDSLDDEDLLEDDEVDFWDAPNALDAWDASLPEKPEDAW